ncbi:hypothetical protein RhiJN_15453 [Ceratobasidium sp. AG-Ba]|nr:hypothetical protein RhiJN_15453 [Ceratobasidium sp. AG-Ba]
MGDSFLRIPSRDAPPLAFSFSNPNASRPKKAHDQQQSSLDPRRRLSTGDHDVHQRASRTGWNASTTDRQIPQSVKPGMPIEATESSTGTNAFKLRANRPHIPTKSANSTPLHHETLELAHTLPIFEPQDKCPVGAFPATTGASAPPEPTSKPNARSRSRDPNSSATLPSSIKYEHSSRRDTPRTRDTRLEINSSVKNLDREMSASSERHEAIAASESEDLRYTPNRDVVGGSGLASGYISTYGGPDMLMPPLKAPSRVSVERKTPAASGRSTHEGQSFKYVELEGQLDTANKKIAILEGELDEREKDSTNAEEKIRLLELQLANECQQATGLLSQINKFRENGVTIKQLGPELATLRQETPFEQSYAVYEEKIKQLREVISEYQANCKQLEESLSQQRGVSDLLREELSRVRGSYSESLELNSELRGLLNSVSGDQLDMFKSLSELHKQIDDQNIQCLTLQASENSANDRIKTLGLSVSSLTDENIRIQRLLTENEQAFAKKLKSLEEENDDLSRCLELARADLKKEAASLESLRSTHEETLVQVEIQRREEYEAKEQVSQLSRELALNIQSLDQAHKANNLSCQRLAEAERDLIQAGTENGILQGRTAELERICGIQVVELQTSQDKLAQWAGELGMLREKTVDTTSAYDKVVSLQNTLSTTVLESERQLVEIAHLKRELSNAKELHTACTAERDLLLGVARVNEERVSHNQREIQSLRDQAEHHQMMAQQANVQQAKEQGLHQAAEQKIKELAKALDDGRMSQKVSNLNAKEAEISNASFFKITQCLQQDETRRLQLQLKQLEGELSLSLSTKTSLDSVISDLQASNQQELSTRRELEQEITGLTNHVSEQKLKIGLLDQQIAASNARSMEHKAEANAHRSDAEAARGSVALVEYRLKEKELEIGNLRSKIQTLEAASAESTVIADPALEACVAEQAQTIDSLNAIIASMHKDAETISGRYRDGKLTAHEKNFITEIMTALTQEKNKVMNGLRGEIKRVSRNFTLPNSAWFMGDLKQKDNEIASNKTTIASQKQSMAAYIGQIDALKKQVEELEGESKAAGQGGLRDTMLQMHQLPSSSLSEAPAPDHDEPASDKSAPDTPTVSSKPTALPADTRQMPSLVVKQKPQQHRTFADLERSHSNAADEIQDFEESEPIRPGGSSGRKRRTTDIEQPEHSEEEQPETKRKVTAKTRKNAKSGEPSAGAKDVANGRSKTGKRRKA